jgi:hypothetical protein
MSFAKQLRKQTEILNVIPAWCPEADAETRIFPGTTGDVADDENNGQDSE